MALLPVALTAALLAVTLTAVILALVCRTMDRELMARQRRIRHQAERIRDYRAELADQEAELLLLRETSARFRAAAALTPDSLPDPMLPGWARRTALEIARSEATDFEEPR
ncbi:hypothetical protein [Salinispora sp. H7-4]|uniref:hypothetical protein n=1 Tax=Salinispora sp. H7-4 TaxID=2748321 RepID=UPI0015D2F1F9|nr:hypothetical protein [Salinispora sp. H7-4]NYT96299.1 hypothetical protein [Salinispora sp. H7-4]